MEKLLDSLYSSLHDFTYHDGTGRVRKTLLDIWCNICLVLNDGRPSFLVQWIDYLEKSAFFCIMDTLRMIIRILNDIDRSKRLLLLTIDQGVLVISYNSFYNNKLYIYYEKYIENGNPEDLAVLLGYPGGDEFNLPSDELYIQKGLSPHGRYHIRFNISSPWHQNVDLITIIYRTEKTKRQILKLYPVFSKILSTYNNDIKLSYQDSSSSPEEEEEDNIDDEDSPEFIAYYDYVLSDEPLNSIWYDDYDLGFSDAFFGSENPLRHE